MDSSPRKPLQLSDADIELIVKALELYDRHVAILNSDVFKISDDDLSDLNNDCEYIKGLIRLLKAGRPS
jgi:hypothetical protein